MSQNSNKCEAIIIKGIGGFYYAEAADQIYECKARGAFRKEKLTPLAGDRVIISINENAENTIDEILPRTSVLTRPPVANIDRLVIVVSSCEPKPNTLVIDKLTAIAVGRHIEPVIVLNKADLLDVASLYDSYTKAGFKTIITSGKTRLGVNEIKALLPGHITAFTGNSGVGKSTLLNCIDESLSLQTAEISKKLGRGKHTTRECTLYKVEDGYVADTPGFASLEILQNEVILKDDLQYCFPEFEPYIGCCKFGVSCAHINDKGCKILEAVERGEIAKPRHESYIAMYNEVKDIKEWSLK